MRAITAHRFSLQTTPPSVVHIKYLVKIMSLSDSKLKGEIVAAMTAVGFAETDGNAKFAEAISKAVIAHIIANAEVNGGVCAPGGAIAGGKIK